LGHQLQVALQNDGWRNGEGRSAMKTCAIAVIPADDQDENVRKTTSAALPHVKEALGRGPSFSSINTYQTR